MTSNTADLTYADRVATHADRVAARAVELVQMGVRFDRISIMAKAGVTEAERCEAAERYDAYLAAEAARIEAADLVVRDAARLAGKRAYAARLEREAEEGELHAAQQEAEREEARVLGWGMASANAW